VKLLSLQVVRREAHFEKTVQSLVNHAWREAELFQNTSRSAFAERAFSVTGFQNWKVVKRALAYKPSAYP